MFHELSKNLQENITMQGITKENSNFVESTLTDFKPNDCHKIVISKLGMEVEYL